MSIFLDKSGVKYLWKQIDGTFAKKGSMMFVGEVVVPSSGWTETTDDNSEIYYTVNVPLEGLTQVGYPVCDVVLSSDIAAARIQKEAYQCINKVSIEDGSVTLYCFEEIPAVSFTLRIQIFY